MESWKFDIYYDSALLNELIERSGLARETLGRGVK